MSWTCPLCGRLFAHRDQPHACTPSDVDKALAQVPPALRPLVDALLAVLVPLAGVSVEYASGSFMVKAPATFAAIRPRKKDVQVSFMLDHEVQDLAVVKALRVSAHRVAHKVFVAERNELDAQLRGWLKEAHAAARRRPSARSAAG